MSKEQIGTLAIVILKARNLNDKHSFYKQDVFATASLNGKEERTHVDVKGGQHPVWDAEIRLPVFKDEGSKYRKLEVACYAKEHRSDDLLGKGVVDITETLSAGEFDEWVPLDIDGVVRGDIYLEMTYFSATPPVGGLKPPTTISSLQRRPSKLSPSDRLSRPPALATSAHVPPPIFEKRPHQSGVNIRPNIAGPKPAPTKQEPLPDILRPAGAGRIPKPTTPQPTAPSVLPSILRPGNPNLRGSSPPSQQNHVPRPQAQQVPHVQPSSHFQPQQPRVDDQYFRPEHSTYQQSYNPHPAASIPNPPKPQLQMNSYSPIPSASPWEPTNGSISFPVPTSSADTYPPQTSHTPPSTNPYAHDSPNHYPSIPNPYMSRNSGPYPPAHASHYRHTSDPVYSSQPPIERYQTPLPLPGGAIPRKQSPPASAPRKASPSVDRTRIDELRQIEKEVAQRNTQEEMDLELALKLDRELNLAEQEASRRESAPHIPGGW